MAQLREQAETAGMPAPIDIERSPLTPALSLPRRGGKAWTLQAKLSPYLFVAPFAILFCVFIIYPLVRSFQLSFYKTIGPAESRFVGFDNYRFLVTDKLMWLALAQTIGYAIAFISIQIPTALGLAVLLDSPRIRARPLFRFAFFSTHLVGSVFVAILFAQILSPRRGLLNDLLGVQIDWLSSPTLALPAVLMAGLWLSVGYAMIYFLAALQSVDRELYEAAQVDGAGRWSQFWHVTLPGIRPVLVFMILVSSIGALQLFELPWVLFQQSPGPMSRALTVVMYLFSWGWSQGDLGYASAIGWTLVVLILTLAIVQLRLAKRMGEG
jgi:ABC-type sugar transport system permease subunit